MASYQIRLTETDETYVCKAGESILHGMARLGKKGIPLGCRGGGCGVCKIQVLEGEYSSRAMSKCHISEAERENHFALACRIYPQTDLEIEVIGKMSKNI